MIIKGPFDEFSRMQKFMQNLFEATRPGSEERARLTTPAWIPEVDAWEIDEGFYLVFDLPGVNREDIQIEVEGDHLTIKGERKTVQDIKYLRKERVSGPFYRAFNLETPVEREKIKATYKAGVLELFLPKKEEVKPRQIQIQVEE